MPDQPASPDPPDDRIRGGFVGGPSRAEEGDPVPSSRIRTLEEIEDGVVRRRMRRVRRRRRTRMFLGAMAATALAGALGVGLGRLTRQTQDDLTTAAEARNQQDDFISREVNRTLLQLWKMEDIEAVRNQGRAR